VVPSPKGISDKLLTRDEYKRMLDLSKRESMRDYVLLVLAGNIGLRGSEIIRLRWEDDRKERFVVPHLKVGKKKGIRKGRVPRGEWPDHTREAIIHPSVRNVLDQWKKECPSKKLLFPSNRDDQHIDRSTFARTFTRYRDKLGLNPKYSPHALRHSFLSWAWDETEDLKFVKELAGHASVATTDRYVHVSKEKLMEAVLKIGTVGL